ncbi:hypothetical protein P879_00052 [Paragonimus westermani]|uniref:Spondin domain-containing protein n=1 Tax=Paragonimus westermani TaxID=34504 RepID=A0A8T0E1A1_9TREM|nr:hypothetical protein P879_00052 [Paragonimus westermani]
MVNSMSPWAIWKLRKGALACLLVAFVSLICGSTGWSFTDADKNGNCQQIPRDSSIVQRPGDGDFEIRIHLVPPSASRIRGSGNRGLSWPLAHTSEVTKSTDIPRSSSELFKVPTEYLPGREYQITIGPKPPTAFSNNLQLEAVYVTAVPTGTPESQEFGQGKGSFTPTICNTPEIGAIELKYNFPRQVAFIWTAPNVTFYMTKEKSRERDNWMENQCVELRATVVPWHWHRVYFRNTGSLRRNLCPAKDVRQISRWPNYIGDTATDMRRTQIQRLGRQTSDHVRVRSISKSDGHAPGDRFSETGYYDTDESGSCALQELPKPVRRCCACNTAIYRLVIQSDWQQQQHWRDWPTFTGEPGSVSPHFSEILGASHSPLYDVFHAGGYASPAVDALCTASDLSKLESEFRNQAGENILTVIRTRGIDSQATPEQRIRSALFAVNGTHHLISFLTRLAPSPDWCTGLSRIDVCLPNCTWPLRMRFRLEPWDAGVMSGNTYVPVEQSERLREPKPMCPITPDLRPNTPFTVLADYDPALPVSHSSLVDSPIRGYPDINMDDPDLLAAGQNPYSNPAVLQEQIRLLQSSGGTPRLRRRFASLGSVELELLRINEHEACTPETTQDDQGQTRSFSSQTASSTHSQGKCQLSAWSQWGPCVSVDLTTCPTPESKAYWSGKAPRMQRTRFILPPSTSADCTAVPLKEEKTCAIPKFQEKCVQVSEGGLFTDGLMTAENCQSLPWGPWSNCINVSCTRPGMIYRWRDFPNITVQRACKDFPLVNQVDVCWPPPNERCSQSEIRKACHEEPPTSVRFCVKPENGTKR